jgi:hypothetical protein
MRRAFLAVGIPRHPDVGALFAHGRDIDRPGVRRNRFGLIDPQQQDFRLELRLSKLAEAP